MVRDRKNLNCSHSDIRTSFITKGDRMELVEGMAELTVCFYLPLAAENFIKGLFMHQTLEIADRKSNTLFHTVGVESVSSGAEQKSNVLLQPLSPIVVGRKNERGHYDYRSPEDADFGECLYYNWIEKCEAIGLPVSDVNEEPDVSIEILFLNRKPQQRLITIKGGTEAETRIRGYTKFKLAVNAPAEMLEVALGAGLGLYNAQGMGCVEVV